jgi:oligoribonuclease NrnB/cAMP/cGMP phosphodiesterase (DHH superfamily)
MTHVLFCSDQLDGIAAAAIIGRALRLHGKDWRLAGTISPGSPESLATVTAVQGASLCLLDIQPNSFGPVADAIQKLTSQNKIAYWCSDMPCKEDVAQHIRGSALASDIVTQKTPLCSAELVKARFLPGDATAQMLAAMARDIKLWHRSDEKAVKLADVIASGHDRGKLVDMFSKGVLWSPSLEAARNDYVEKREKALQELVKHINIKDYVGVKYGFSLAPNFLPSADACQHLLDIHVAIGVAVIVYRDGRIVFRRRSGVKVDLEEVAKLFDGGGREYASGGRIKAVASVSGETFEKVLFGVDRTLKDFFLQ